MTPSSHLAAVDPQTFTQVLRRVLFRLRYAAIHYSIHSFRRGGATYADSSGFSRAATKAQVNWHSSCFQRYNVRNDDLRKSFYSKIAKQFFLAVLAGFGRFDPLVSCFICWEANKWLRREHIFFRLKRKFWFALAYAMPLKVNFWPVLCLTR